MNMKDHLVAALREQFQRWEALLASLPIESITTWQVLSNWSIHDVIAHVWGWQQITLARIEAAAQDRPPKLPDWVAALPADWEAHADQTNAWIYQTYHAAPWPTVHQQWREGYLRCVEASAAISERDLLDSGRYSWLDGRPLALLLLSTYDHHQEHFEKLLAWLDEHGHGMQMGDEPQ